jgi:cobalt-zinc-cadmium efflux system protein
MSFGYHRVGVLAALANAASLVVIGLLIFWEAFRRFQHPEPVDAGMMMAVAAIAVVLNGAIGWSLHGGTHDLNVRSAYLHMLGDAISAGGVVVAGALAWKTGSTQIDPLVSVLIGLMILWSSWSILRESINVLLEGVPAHINLPDVEAALRRLPNMKGVHHMHAWTISSGFNACSCHIVPEVASTEACDRLLKDAERVLADFQFRHTTIQLETTPCAPPDQHCTDTPAHVH